MRRLILLILAALCVPSVALAASDYYAVGLPGTSSVTRSYPSAWSSPGVPLDLGKPVKLMSWVGNDGRRYGISAKRLNFWGDGTYGGWNGNAISYPMRYFDTITPASLESTTATQVAFAAGVQFLSAVRWDKLTRPTPKGIAYSYQPDRSAFKWSSYTGYMFGNHTQPSGGYTELNTPENDVNPMGGRYWRTSGTAVNSALGNSEWDVFHGVAVVLTRPDTASAWTMRGIAVEEYIRGRDMPPLYGHMSIIPTTTVSAGAVPFTLSMALGGDFKPYGDLNGWLSQQPDAVWTEVVGGTSASGVTGDPLVIASLDQARLAQSVARGELAYRSFDANGQFVDGVAPGAIPPDTLTPPSVPSWVETSGPVGGFVDGYWQRAQSWAGNLLGGLLWPFEALGALS